MAYLFSRILDYFSGFPERSLIDVEDEYDYIILGGGTAGCVIANRLSEGGLKVLLVERGSVGDSWASRVPLFSQGHQSTDGRALRFNTIPQKHVNERELELMAGNSLGGGTKINAMSYTRGLPAEYNAWSAAGRKGWSYDDLRDFFIKSETDLDKEPDTPDNYHGVQATTMLGIPYIKDLNSPLEPAQGCAKLHYSIDARGHRSSTFSAFLPRNVVNERKATLHICTNATAFKIQTEGEYQALRARSVLLRSTKKESPDRKVRARCEIILCAGAFGSPQVLMLSGIGPEEHLKEHGIPLVQNLPGVGNYLQDHVSVPIQYCVPLEESLVKFQLRPWKIIKEIMRYILFGTGILLAPIIELSVYSQSRLLNDNFEQKTRPKDRDSSLPENLPDIEIMALAFGSPEPHKVLGGELAFLVANLRPTSLGSVKLASTDPLDNPIVDLNFLATENDWDVMRKGLKLGMRIGREMAALGYDISEHTIPQSDSDSDMDHFIRKYCRSTMHYCSTCRMAPEHSEDGTTGGVVDDRLRVHGIRGLRVADASIFPEILSTHLAAPTVVVAEKCARMVLDDHSNLMQN
ncbi:GMC oxidoreductase [Phlegmacium glaucopus]|nr:GMC oxidoreductase [Phlegmacium glaucopus]